LYDTAHNVVQAMERLKGATLTVSLVNGACATLDNRFLKAHAEAWLTMKYSLDRQTGTLVPQAFAGMVIPVTPENMYTVRQMRQHCAGEHEHQDLAPDKEDVHTDAQQSAQGGWNQGSDEFYESCWGDNEGGSWREDENDKPEYEDFWADNEGGSWSEDENDLPVYEDDLPDYEDN